ncbi:mCG1042733 [Mus musculus]|nr:mCG1042733 [Mus musculus]
MQEFMIFPIETSRFHEGLRGSVAVYHNLKSAIREKYRKGATNVSDGTGLHLTSWRTHGPWPGGENT